MRVPIWLRGVWLTISAALVSWTIHATTSSPAHARLSGEDISFVWFVGIMALMFLGLAFVRRVP